MTIYLCFYIKKNKVHRISAKNYLKSIKFKTPHNTDIGRFHSFNHQKWPPYQILGGNPKERPNRFTYNGDMVDKLSNYIEAELLTTQ